MKHVLIITALFIIPSISQAVYLMTCSNYPYNGEVVSYSYESCINDNYMTIEREMEDISYLPSCRNFSRTMVDYGFTSCINDNFREIEREFDRIYLQRCTNLMTSELSYFFISCVNDNFREIERHLNRDLP